MNRVCRIFVVLVIAVTGCKGCPDNWVNRSSSCYHRFETPKNYKDALEHCHKLEATLVNINSEEENTFLYTSFIENGKDRLQSYIGVVRETPGGNTFVTSEGKPQTYFNWAWGEPNNFLFLGENCVVMKPSGQWNDIVCTLKLPFICEAQIISCEDNPCKNGGICIDIPEQNRQAYQCRCPEPFYGMNCEQEFKGCQEGWIAFEHHCYRVIPGKRPWNVAKTVCELDGGNLVVIKSEEQNAFISKNFPEYNLWIGIVECLCGKKCAVDFSKVKYSKWDTCEPKDLDDARGCAMMEKGSGKWQNRDCNEMHHAVCKRESMVGMAQA